MSRIDKGFEGIIPPPIPIPAKATASAAMPASGGAMRPRDVVASKSVAAAPSRHAILESLGPPDGRVAIAPPLTPQANAPAIAFPLEETSSKRAWGRVFLDRYAPSITSMILHALVVMVLALITFSTPQEGGPFLSGVFTDDSTTLTAEITAPLDAPDPTSSDSLSSAPGRSLDDAIAGIDVPLAPDVFDGDILSGGMGGEGRGGDGVEAMILAEGDRSASFFGLSAKGKRFVFVIDSSTSMWGPRWIDVRQELLRSVRKLNQDQYFFVVCFDVASTSMFGEGQRQRDFAAANEENFRKLEYWLAQHTLGPGTMANASVLEALRLKPDAIFLLTDGEFQDNVLQTFRNGNRNRGKKKKIPVHTIGFHSKIGAPVLSQIASENNGQFRYVPPGENLPQTSRPVTFAPSGRIYPPQSIEELMLTPR